eukprot:scaffold165616_cov58-Attheya_sp.AAC.1
MAPALMEVPTKEEANKYMMWPLAFVAPGQEKEQGAPDESPLLTEARANGGTGQWRTMEIVPIPESVVAVATLTDVSMGPVVRMADAQLRKVLASDGLEPFSTPSLNSAPGVRFAQYDAVFSMGQRRSEVWIDLSKHPW